MDTIKVKCKCGATLQVSPEMAGRLGTCAKCGKTMRIPHDLHAKTAAAPKKITLQPETGPVAAHEEPAVELLAVEWPAMYKKAVVMSIVAVVILGAALGVLVLLPSMDKPDVVEEEKYSFSDPKTGLRMNFSSEWKVDGSATGAKVVFVNDRLSAEVVLETGADMTLTEMRPRFLREAEAMSGYEPGKGPKTPNSYELGTYFELKWKHKPQGSTVSMVTMVRAFRKNGRSFVFHVTAPDDSWDIPAGVDAEFETAWKSIRFASGPEITN